MVVIWTQFNKRSYIVRTLDSSQTFSVSKITGEKSWNSKCGLLLYGYMKISEDPAEMLQKTATWKEEDFQECYPRRGWKFTDEIRKFFRKDGSSKRGTNPPREQTDRPSGSQTPEVSTTPRQRQSARGRGIQLVSSERIESRRASTQDGDSQTRGRPIVRQRMRTESLSVPRPETRENWTYPRPLIVESRGIQEPPEFRVRVLRRNQHLT